MPVHQPRLAEIVAGRLRERIVSGELGNGGQLPRQEELMEEYGVGKPAMREALRALEIEGLITIRRGNRGGAIVHPPQVRNAAYAVGLVLHSRRVLMSDLREAVMSIEPVCAGLCAAREDRHEAVLPDLREAHERAVAHVDDELKHTQASRDFHELLVRHCGNQTLILVVGALESLWSERELAWARDATGGGPFPDPSGRQQGLDDHARMLELIEAGDVDGVQQEARAHLNFSLNFARDDRFEHTVDVPAPPRP